MPRHGSAFWDKRAGCWASSALGELAYTKEGKAYRKKAFNRSLRHPTKDRLAAQRWVAEELERQAAGLVVAAELDFEAMTEIYLFEAERRLGPEAYDRTVEHLSRFGNWPSPGDPNRMDRRKARSITRGDGEQFRDAMLAQGCSESYVSDGLLKTLKACFRWAAEMEPGRHSGLPLPANPMTGLRGPTVPRRAFRRIDPEAVSRFIRWAWRRATKAGDGPNGIHARSAIVLLMTLRDTGARPKDLCVAEWDDWSLLPGGWGLLRLPAWKWKNGNKTGEDRIIAVPPHCARRIEAIRARPDRHATAIFTHRRPRGHRAANLGTAEAGEPWVWLDPERKRKGDTKMLQQWFNRLRTRGAAEGYPLPEGFRLYFNRSYYTTEARRRGVNDAALAKALGTSVRMLDRHYTDQDESDVLGVAMAAKRPITASPNASGSAG
ncbi:tyrosine-type recombinase/integrase [Singulisphaera sp. PoT]|uniref:tyrosine-type recombinase/integrase n=1 Tax=Singulisphaera sp. PoT TaxID=3411797 RepID=UPI003BF4D696